MKLVILSFLLVAVVVRAATVIFVARCPIITVTVDVQSNAVACATGVVYNVEIPQPIGNYRDSITFGSLQECLQSPTIVTNAIYTQCAIWKSLTKSHWNLDDPTIIFSVGDTTVITNVQESVP
jgi:hypothetical protein